MQFLPAENTSPYSILVAKRETSVTFGLNHYFFSNGWQWTAGGIVLLRCSKVVTHHNDLRILEPCPEAAYGVFTPVRLGSQFAGKDKTRGLRWTPDPKPEEPPENSPP
jgi:hypothetical protein